MPDQVPWLAAPVDDALARSRLPIGLTRIATSAPSLARRRPRRGTIVAVGPGGLDTGSGG